jgi:hypothetical protein
MHALAAAHNWQPAVQQQQQEEQQVVEEREDQADAADATRAVTPTANNSSLHSIGGAAEISRQNGNAGNSSSSTSGHARDSSQAYEGLSLSAFRAVFGENTAAAERALSHLAPAALRQQLLALGNTAAAAIPGQQVPQQQQGAGDSAELGTAAADAADAAAPANAGEDASTAVGSSSRATMQLTPTQAVLATDSTSSNPAREVHTTNTETSGAGSVAANAPAPSDSQQVPLNEMLWDLLDILHTQLVADPLQSATSTYPACCRPAAECYQHVLAVQQGKRQTSKR